MENRIFDTINNAKSVCVGSQLPSCPSGCLTYILNIDYCIYTFFKVVGHTWEI